MSKAFNVNEKAASDTLSTEKVRRTVLDAALSEFAELGFGGATIRGIAARTTSSHGMIRYYFGSKEKLWEAAVDHLFEKMGGRLTMSQRDLMALEGGDLDIFRDWLRAYVRYCAEYPEHARIMMAESVSPSSRLSYVSDNYARTQHEAANQVVDILKGLSVVDPILPTASVIYMISGACQNIFALSEEVKLSLGVDTLSEEYVEAHAEAVVRQFCPPDN